MHKFTDVDITELATLRNEYGDYMSHKSQTVRVDTKEVVVYLTPTGRRVRTETTYY
jgi:hypothetical protein